MNGQMAFISSFPLPLHSYSHSLHGHGLHCAHGHPTQEPLLPGGLAPPSSASFGGVAQRRLPFRPAAAGLPVVVDCPHTNSNHHQAYPHPSQNNLTHSHLSTDQSYHPATLRMGSFEQSQDEELARLQELSNKWEPEANASRSQNISPRVLCFREDTIPQQIADPGLPSDIY